MQRETESGLSESTVSFFLMKEPRMMQSELAPREILSTLGINGMPTVTPVQGGFDMAMWKVEHEGQTSALRVFPAGAQEDCEYERGVMAAARAAGLPVPEVQRAGVYQDRPVLLITWLAGRTVEDDLRARPWRLGSLGDVFGRLQASDPAAHAPDQLRQQPDARDPRNGDSQQAIRD